jgi:hypothetical protein
MRAGVWRGRSFCLDVFVPFLSNAALNPSTGRNQNHAQKDYSRNIQTAIHMTLLTSHRMMINKYWRAGVVDTSKTGEVIIDPRLSFAT